MTPSSGTNFGEEPQVDVDAHDGDEATIAQDAGSKRPSMLVPMKVLDDSLRIMADGYLTTQSIGAAAGILKRRLPGGWSLEGDASERMFRQVARPFSNYRRYEGGPRPVPGASRTDEGAVPVSETLEVAAARKAWDEAKRSGDPDAMTRTANALIRAVERARVQSGAAPQATPRVDAGGSARHPIDEILQPQAQANSNVHEPPPARGIGGALPRSAANAIDGAARALRKRPESDADVRPGYIATDDGAKRVTQANSDADRPPGWVRDTSPGANAQTLSPEHVEWAANEIMEAPEGERVELLHQFRERSGAVMMAQVMESLPEQLVPALLDDTLGEEDSFARVKDQTSNAAEGGGKPDQLGARATKDRPRLLPETHEGTICRNGECRRARHSLEIDDQIKPEIRRVEAEAIAREYGPYTTVDTLKRKASFHQYYQQTRIRAPGRSCAQVVRQTQIRAVPQAFHKWGAWRDRPPKNDDWTWVWSIPVVPGLGIRLPTPGAGFVYHFVDRRTGVLVNMTTALHPLNPGYILRWATCERDGTFLIHTLGRGTGNFGAINETMGPSMFFDLDTSVAEDLGGAVLPPSAYDAY